MPGQDRAVKVRIIADTVIHRDGRGVPVFVGSVMNVTPEEASLLLSSVKAERAKPEDPEIVVANPAEKKTAPSKESR